MVAAADALMEHDAVPEARRSALCALANLASVQPDCQGVILSDQYKMMEAVVTAVERHLDDASVQTSALCLLLNLCPGHAAALGQKHGALGITLAAMRAHPDAGDLQGFGCELLAHLPSSEEEKKVECIPELVAALRRSLPHAAVQHQGCRALVGLAVRHTGSQGWLVELEGLPELAAAAMREHPDDASVEHYARSLQALLLSQEVCSGGTGGDSVSGGSAEDGLRKGGLPRGASMDSLSKEAALAVGSEVVTSLVTSILARPDDPQEVEQACLMFASLAKAPANYELVAEKARFPHGSRSSLAGRAEPLHEHEGPVAEGRRRASSMRLCDGLCPDNVRGDVSCLEVLLAAARCTPKAEEVERRATAAAAAMTKRSDDLALQLAGSCLLKELAQHQDRQCAARVARCALPALLATLEAASEAGLNPETKQVCQVALAALAALGRGAAEVSQEIASGGAVALALQALRTPAEPGIAALQAEACHLLVAMAESSPQCVPELVTDGAVEAAVAALSGWAAVTTSADLAKAAAVQRGAMQVLAAFSSQAKGCLARVSQQMAGVSAVVKAMAGLREEEAAQAAGCALLAGIGQLNSTHCAAIGKEGGLAAVVAGMQAHPLVGGVQLEGMRALEVLLTRGPEAHARLVADCSGVQAVVQALEDHAGGQHGAAVLSVCGRAGALLDPDCLTLLAASQGIRAVLRAMRACLPRASATPPDEAAAAALVQGIRGLSELSREEANLAVIVEEQGEAVLVAALRAKPEAAVLQALGCAVARSLAGQDAARAALLQAGGLATVLQAMKDHPQRALIQGNGCQTLIKCAASLETRAELVALEALEVLLAAMCEHPDDAHVQKTAMRLLQSLILDDSATQERANRLGAQGRLVTAMQTHSAEDAVQASACAALVPLLGLAPPGGASGTEGGEGPEESALAAMMDSVLEALSRHRASPLVAEHALVAIGALSQRAVCHAHLGSDMTASLVMGALKEHAQDAAVQRRGVSLLELLLTTSEHIKQLVLTHGALGMVVKAMGEHADAVEVQVGGARFMARLTSGSHQELMVKHTGAVAAVVAAMLRHKSEVQMLDEGSQVLVDIVKVADHQHAVLSSNAVDGMIAAMAAVPATAPEALQVNLRGCQLMCALGEHPATARKSAVPVILAAMSAFPEEHVMQQQGLRVLAHQAEVSQEILNEIATEAGIEAVVRAVQARAENAELQHGGCWLLSLCALQQPAMLVAQGAVRIAVRAASSHLADPAVVQYAGRLLAELAEHNPAQAREEGAVAAVCAALQGLPGDAKVHRCGFRALGAIAHSSEEEEAAEGQVSVLDAEGYELVLAGMWRHMREVGVQETACHALAELTATAELEPAVEARVLRAVLEAMKTHPKQYRVLMHGCWVLANLAGMTDSSPAAIASQGGIKLVLGAMKALPEEEAVVENACFALAELSASNQENRVRPPMGSGLPRWVLCSLFVPARVLPAVCVPGSSV
ncbi:hypothetical protein CYMTET_32693 [Cymbomonas tetramitiformis]|uniref:LRRK2 ARM repeat domain-containing protein n=1 Tax=Cymbomonas tetramitiformis TaxID=36881 RepID=A0AAE0KRL7_9CHLO|nr:hypothetical protein CYMTET_32693 [Cymbomonas tetramitiformis]